MNDIIPLTSQRVFDAALNGIAAQGFKRSASEGSVCLYRGPNGLKCAIGHSIPDKLYTSTIEGKSVSWLVEEPEFKHLYSGVDKFLLTNLQKLHDKDVCDEPIDPETFLRVAQDLAHKCGLVYTVPPK